MNLLRRIASHRTLIFGFVALACLVVTALYTFDFRVAEILNFMLMCLLMIAAIILTAVLGAAALIGLKRLLRRIGG